MKLVTLGIALVLMVCWHKAETRAYYYSYEDYDSYENDDRYEDGSPEDYQPCALARGQYGRGQYGRGQYGRYKRGDTPKRGDPPCVPPPNPWVAFADHARANAHVTPPPQKKIPPQIKKPAPAPCNPNYWFEQHHVCKDCLNDPAAALAFTIRARGNQPHDKFGDPITTNTVFIGNDISYISDSHNGLNTCRIRNPVITYVCTRPQNGDWVKCALRVPKHMCTAHHSQANGHLYDRTIHCV